MTTGLKEAEQALERGDYGQCLRLLEPLAEAHPITDPKGASVRMVMVTAWMGQGDDQKAIATCRLLTRCKDVDLRNRARQLLSVLEAPSLDRPARWSMQLPTLEMAPKLGKRPRSSRRSRKPKPPPPPPTGPTRGPSAGFAALVLAVLLGLTLLLSGCVRVSADLELGGPDRLAMHWQINSLSGRRLPWQENFANALQSEGLNWSVNQQRAGGLTLSSPTLTGQQASTLLSRSVELAGRTAGQTFPPPELSVQERNWLIGVQQNLDLKLDLTGLASFTSGDLQVTVQPVTNLKHVQASPNQATLKQQMVRWPLERGAINQLRIRRWQWSRLGLGSVVVGILLLLSLLLQSVRLRLGFGYPELPS